MKVGVLGSGGVAQTLAAGFLKHGHEVAIGTREPAKLAEWLKANPKAMVGSSSDAAAFGEVLVLAVKGSAAADVLRAAGTKNLEGKPVLDACNPIADAPPVNGVLQFSTAANTSLMEELQKEFPGAHLVKAFNSVGQARFVNPEYKGVRPTMFICGNDDGAKAATAKILDQFGWETADMGKAESARAIEPLCMLWCILGFTKNEWTHAFKLLRV
jgi:8-hydroxy-5-deazaflavin:NADPH oxidoreductase